MINFPLPSNSETLSVMERQQMYSAFVILTHGHALHGGKTPRGSFHPKVGPFDLVFLPFSMLPYTEPWPWRINLVSAYIFAH